MLLTFTKVFFDELRLRMDSEISAGWTTAESSTFALLCKIFLVVEQTQTAVLTYSPSVSSDNHRVERFLPEFQLTLRSIIL